MGEDLVEGVPADDGISVALVAGAEASGLADMLHQFIEQTLADSPRKRRQAEKLVGEVEFRAAEDEEIAVRIAFGEGRIELHDGGTQGFAGPAITADFLTIAHLTAGMGNPLWLLVRRELRLRASARELPFLLGVLRFMRIEAASGRSRRARRRAARARWAWGAAAAAGCAAAYWIATTYF